MAANIKVTVVTTTYNSMDFLPEAIESIRQQEFQNYEHIVVNDGSTDETEEYLNQISDPKVQIFNLPRSGRGVCLNFAISKSKGEYIAILDSDDISSKNRLLKSTAVITVPIILAIAPAVVLFGLTILKGLLSPTLRPT